MIIDGLKIANNIKNSVQIDGITNTKKLGLIYEGSDKNQRSYMKRIKKDFEPSIMIDLWNIEDKSLLGTVKRMESINNLYDKVLPIKPFSDKTHNILLETLDRTKDIDNYLGFKNGYSCTSEAVQEIIIQSNVSIQHSNIVVLGSRGEGDDIIRILTNRSNNGTVIGIHSKTPKHLKAKLLSQADIVILATGQKDIYTMEDLEANIARDLCVIDVGRGEIEQEVVDYCKNTPHTHVTTAINGVGVVTTACLLRRVLNS